MIGKIRSQDIKKFSGDYSALIAFMIIFIVAIILRGQMFLSFSNIINILRNNAVVGIISLGMTLIIIIGGVDLSVGSQLVITGWIGLVVLNFTQSLVLGFCAGILAGIVSGVFSGVLVAKFKIPTFILTLGTMSIYRSIVQNALKGGGLMAQGGIAGTYIAISNSSLWGVPLPIIYWIILSFILYLFTTQTATGRYVYAVGSNEKATMLSSINVVKVKIVAFALSGTLVALAAIIETSRLGSINSASSGTTYHMDAISAAVIGGTSMSGGKGKIIGTIFGTLTLGIINNMLNLLGVPPFLVGVAKGAIIIGAVLFQKGLDRQ